jgi:hypothetical protein
MHMTNRELWTALHGMIFGAGFLLAFSGGFFGLWGLRSDWLTEEGAKRRLCVLAVGTWGMTILAWLAVILGTYVIYPWYRAKPPASSSVSLADYPKYFLLSDSQTADWHEFGMEWKEHIAWLAPILATAVAVIVSRHGRLLLQRPNLRRVTLILFNTAFLCAAIAGLLGALINKAAPTR